MRRTKLEPETKAKEHAHWQLEQLREIGVGKAFLSNIELALVNAYLVGYNASLEDALEQLKEKFKI